MTHRNVNRRIQTRDVFGLIFTRVHLLHSGEGGLSLAVAHFKGISATSSPVMEHPDLGRQYSNARESGENADRGSMTLVQNWFDAGHHQTLKVV